MKGIRQGKATDRNNERPVKSGNKDGVRETDKVTRGIREQQRKISEGKLSGRGGDVLKCVLVYIYGAVRCCAREREWRGRISRVPRRDVER